ncbi:MAG: hypothetical protein CMG00_02395 [Candidatus Marinimicrobia bacterium]|nr:hypothetical protein [Candidatus Neomarinimicrobiota bacterium]|tara:strand:- start:8101 stop:8601 length:501 start_codon:yes stop_codon:yes gene_type:complete
MKYLLLNRHAKSPWGGLKISDHDRELDSRGVDDSVIMGKKLHRKGILFDTMITSTAKRALTTCELIASEVGYPIEKIKLEAEIYQSDKNILKSIISKIDNNVNSVAIFGHNPTFHELADELSDSGISRFPVCAMLFVEFDAIRWSNLFTNSRREVFYLDPGIVRSE